MDLDLDDDGQARDEGAPEVPSFPPPLPVPEELPPRLRCEGGELIKPNGSAVFLHGVNFGSWGEDDAADCPAISALGANALRINLRWRGKWGTEARANPDSWDPDAFAFINPEKRKIWLSQIAAAAQAALWSVPFIDSNCGQSGTNSPEDVAYCDPYGTWGPLGHNFYRDPAMRRVFASVVWREAARALRLIPRVGLLEIHPEPAHHRDETWAPAVAQVQLECILAIRAAEAELGDLAGTPILVGPREGYDIRYVEEAFFALTDAFGGTLPENLVWTGNLLNQWIVNPPRFDKGVQRLVDLREQYGAVPFVQQLGRNSSEDVDLSLMKRALAALREANIGYTWWQWKQNTSNAANMGLHFKNPSDASGATWIAKQGELDALEAEWKGDVEP